MMLQNLTHADQFLRGPFKSWQYHRLAKQTIHPSVLFENGRLRVGIYARPEHRYSMLCSEVYPWPD